MSERVRAQATQPLGRGAATAEDVAEELQRFALQLRRPRMRARLALLAMPGAPRMFVAIGVAITISAPSIARWQGIATLEWHGVALMCLFVAWLFAALDRFVQRDIDVAFANMRLAESGSAYLMSTSSSGGSAEATDSDAAPGDASSAA